MTDENNKDTDRLRKESSDLVNLAEESLRIVHSSLKHLINEYKIGDRRLLDSRVENSLNEVRSYIFSCPIEIHQKYPPAITGKEPLTNSTATVITNSTKETTINQ